jgi:hypothetical protein
VRILMGIGDKVGDKVRNRIKAVPQNIKAAVDEVRTDSIATAAGNAPKRFGKENRRLLDR